jgi:hypothetical protein
MDPETEGWALGSFCVMNEETNPHFDELLYAQHFAEDQRIAAQIELEETRKEDGSIKSPVLAFKEAWYEVNPIDTSESGLLARYTGMTKDDAEDVIALIYYYDYLANYHPPEEEKVEYKLKINQGIKNDFLAQIINNVEFYDNRNRSYAA